MANLVAEVDLSPQSIQLSQTSAATSHPYSNPFSSSFPTVLDLDFTAVNTDTYSLEVSGAGNVAYSPLEAGSGSSENLGEYDLEITVGAAPELEILSSEDPTNDTLVEAIDTGLSSANPGSFIGSGFIGDNPSVTPGSNARVRCRPVRNPIFGESGADSPDGGEDNDNIDGGEGNSSISGGGGKDRIFGESGADILNGDAGDDAIDGGEGNDSIFGGRGRDRISGGAGVDNLADPINLADPKNCPPVAAAPLRPTFGQHLAAIALSVSLWNIIVGY